MHHSSLFELQTHSLKSYIIHLAYVLMVAYFFQHWCWALIMSSCMKKGKNTTSPCKLVRHSYSFLPKFLHQSWEGIGRTGWCGRCCNKSITYVSISLHNKQIDHVAVTEIVVTACLPYEGSDRENRSTNKRKEKPTNTFFLLYKRRK